MEAGLKTVGFEVNREARQALTLSVAGSDGYYVGLEFGYVALVLSGGWKRRGEGIKARV